MPSLVQRCRQIIASENDDFFQAETIRYYINKSQRNVVNYMSKQEMRPTVKISEDQVAKGAQRSLRALDSLRSINTTTLSSVDFTNQGDYWTGLQTFPSDLLQILYVRYNQRTIVRELNAQKLYMLDWGVLKPTTYESYYYVTDSTGGAFELYLPEDPATNDLNVFYIKEPTEITNVTDEVFVDLPEQLENAVIYGAAVMMIGQESVKDPTGNVQTLISIYQQELQNAAL